ASGSQLQSLGPTALHILFVSLIYLPINVTVAELGNVTLPCYADTQSGGSDVTWLHYEQKALHYTAVGATIPGLGYEERVSLTEDGYRDGDVSLTITGVNQTDAGLYRCFVRDETDRGYPHAYMLHVIGKTHHMTICTFLVIVLFLYIFGHFLYFSFKYN
uniref:Ig-like domain-containing protein n=1 Tax=Cyprinus carpio TaxID=7962 RepID=A0A8C1PMH9_CYPCA